MINRALWWKEMRMQRPVLLSGVAFAALAPLLVFALLSTEERYGVYDIVRGVPTALAALWPFLAVAAGAITFATEAEDGTAGFLLSRPVSRVRVWCVKVGAAAATLALVGFLSLAVERIVALGIGPVPADYFARANYGDWTMFVSSTVLGLGALMFASGVFCSTIVGRPLTAAAAAIALGLTILAAVFLLWAALDLTPHLEPQWLGAQAMVVSAILLIVSLLVFSWPEQFAHGPSPSTSGRAVAGGGAALLLSAVVMPVLFSAATPRVAEVAVVPGSVSYGSRTLVMSMQADGGPTQNWILATDGGGMQPLTGRHTLAPQGLSRGNLVAYYSRRGVFGGDSGTLDLRVTDTSGSMSWQVFRGMPGVRELFFRNAGRNGSVAFVDGAGLIVAKLNGHGHRTIDLTGTPLAGANLLGFNDARPSMDELVFVTGDLDVASGVVRTDGALFVYELDSGEIRELAPLGAGSLLPGPLRNLAADATSVPGRGEWGSIPTLVAVDQGDGVFGVRLENIDTVTGESRVVYEIGTAWTDDAGRRAFQRCAAAEIGGIRRFRSEERPGRTFREDQLLFGDCSVEAREEFGAGAIRLVGLRTGNLVNWSLPSTLEGTVHRAYVGQRQQKVLLDLRGATPADVYALLIDLDGTAQAYPRGWAPLGWTTLDYFLLQRDTADGVTFAVGDVRDGEMYGLFPENELRAVLLESLEQQRQEDARAGGANAGR